MKLQNTIGRTVIFCVIAVAQFALAAPEAVSKEPHSVTIKNTSANPVPVNVQNQVITQAGDNPAFQPYFDTEIQTNITGSEPSVSFSVPEGKRLVIEHVTVNILLTSGEAPPEARISLATISGGLASAYLTLEPQSTDRYVGTHLVRLYAVAGQNTVTVVVRRAISSGFVSIAASVSGYLVDLP